MGLNDCFVAFLPEQLLCMVTFDERLDVDSTLDLVGQSGKLQQLMNMQMGQLLTAEAADQVSATAVERGCEMEAGGAMSAAQVPPPPLFPHPTLSRRNWEPIDACSKC
jgi:hypothetical protein